MSVDLHILEGLRQGKKQSVSVWEPFSPVVVLGRSGIREREVFVEACQEDSVQIFGRRTGGGAVVLSPGMLVLSLAKKIEVTPSIQDAISVMNGLVADFLSGLGVENITHRGLADICIGERKIVGAGLYLGKDVIFYQASILVNPDLTLMERYLRHPPREPEYRQGRCHADFVTSLKEEGYSFEARALISSFNDFIWNNIDRISFLIGDL